MSRKAIYTYQISRGYVKCEVYTSDPRTHARVGTSTLTPDKGLSREQRRSIIGDWLRERFGIRNPAV